MSSSIPADHAGASAEAFASLVRNRHSIRGFRPDPVPEELLQKVFEDARWAPSGTNVQPWHVLVASGATRDALRAGFLERFDAGVDQNRDHRSDGKTPGVWMDRKRACARAMYGAMGIEWEDRPGRQRAARRNYELFDAPHVVFFGMHETFGLATAADIGIYAQTLMLSMTANGLASCPQGTLAAWPDFTREVFGLDPEIKILFGLSFGFEDPDMAVNTARTERATVAESVTFRN